MLLMLMVVTLHIQYKDLFAGKDVLDINNKSSSRGDHIQRNSKCPSSMMSRAQTFQAL